MTMHDSLKSPREDMNFAFKPIVKVARAKEMRGGVVPEAPDFTRVISAHSSAYLLQTGDKEFALFDAGMDSRARNIHRTLTQINADLTTAAVKAIFVTHGHRDHVGGLAAFPNADIYVHKSDAPYIRGDLRAQGKLGKVLGKLPKNSRPKNPQNIQEIIDGHSVTIGDHTITAHEVPGHTSGSVAYSVGNTLLIGDAMYFDRDGEVGLSPSFLSHHHGEATTSLAGLADILDDRGIEINTVIPAHSGAGSMDKLRSWTKKSN